MDNKDLHQRIHQELLDSLDEELELELDDDRLSGEADTEENRSNRMKYFKELLRLQGELVKLQDWVLDKKLKVLVIFEGRDSAGKGGRLSALLNA
jgi:polyphosphate kinase 2 (PPK2 family)